MRKAVLLFFIIALSTLTFGQSKDEIQTLVSGDFHLSGFGAPELKISRMNDDLAVMIGGRGGMIFNHQLVLGGGGYGLVNDVPVAITPDSTRYLNFGYGGFFLGYIMAPNKLIHLDFNTLIAAGGLGFRDAVFRDWDDEWDEYEDFDVDAHTDAVLVLEPTLNLILNLTTWMRLGVGASYRYVYGLDNPYIGDLDMSGGSLTFSLKFGMF